MAPNRRQLQVRSAHDGWARPTAPEGLTPPPTHLTPPTNTSNLPSNTSCSPFGTSPAPSDTSCKSIGSSSLNLGINIDLGLLRNGSYLTNLQPVMALVYHGLHQGRHKETEGECLELVLNQMHRLDLRVAAVSYYCIDRHPTRPHLDSLAL